MLVLTLVTMNHGGNKMIDQNEIPKYRKKSKKRGLKRADHKHEYKTVLLKYTWTFSSSDRVYESTKPTKVCMICGRIDKVDYDESLYTYVPDRLGIIPVNVKQLSEKGQQLERWHVSDALDKFAAKDSDN